MEGQESAKRNLTGDAEMKREQNKIFLSNEAEKCYNIIHVFHRKTNENTFKATKSEPVMSNKTSSSMI